MLPPSHHHHFSSSLIRETNDYNCRNWPTSIDTQNMSQQPTRKSAAGAVGAKTARACDSCLLRRARWYCAADDAFLCQLCDNSVHTANPLARRHERVRLKTSSSSTPSLKPLKLDAGEGGIDQEPAWHHGFKRKARTPRGGGAKGAIGQKKEEEEEEEEEEEARGGMFGRLDTIVPDLDLASLEEFAPVEEEQLLYRVPILEPVVLAELCSPPPASSVDEANKPDPPPQASTDQSARDHPPMVLPIESDVEISDFQMDVESLLGRGLDADGEDAFSMEELGLVEDHADNDVPVLVKEEEEEEDSKEGGLPLPPIVDRQPRVDVDDDVNFDCGSPRDEKAEVDRERKKRRRIMLNLNYEGVICAWDKQVSPWVNGARPQLDLDHWSPDYMWGGGGDVAQAEKGGEGSGHGTRAGGGGDGGREARVSRYREKRRMRLFSKKIRYEVRKLNAEKRPRMKGRFVKRASLLSNTTTAAGGHGVVPQPQYVF